MQSKLEKTFPKEITDRPFAFPISVFLFVYITLLTCFGELGFFLIRWSVSRVRQEMLTLGNRTGSQVLISIFIPPSFHQKLSPIFLTVTMAVSSPFFNLCFDTIFLYFVVHGQPFFLPITDMQSTSSICGRWRYYPRIWSFFKINIVFI